MLTWEAKDVGGYSAEQKAAIFGTAGKKDAKKKEDEEDDEEEVGAMVRLLCSCLMTMAVISM